MGLLEDLSLLGVDTDKAVTNFMNNQALYEKMLKKLPQVIEDKPVMPFAKDGDFTTALSNAHALKGVTGNLALKPLYDNYSEIVACFRNGDNEKAVSLLGQTAELQERFISCIKKYCDN